MADSSEADVVVNFLRGAGRGRLRSMLRVAWNRATAQHLASPSGEQTLDVMAALRRMEQLGANPAVLVPIFNAPSEVENCISALLRHTAPNYRIVLIDDASTDSAIKVALAKYAHRPNVEIHTNPRNLGFTRTVNKGLEMAGTADVVLLNSDTQVTPRWMENLRLAAYSGDRVATATPFSNNAGAFSAPQAGRDNPLPDNVDLDSYARLITQISSRSYPQVPTGSGFCMYIRRDCIDEIGTFDAEAFPRGYGEENDFCMRARRRGWTHVIDDATFIYHVRAASFGGDKAALLRHGRVLVDQRYPDYPALVRAMDRDLRLRQARSRIASALARNKVAPTPIRRRVIMVASAEGPNNAAAAQLRFECYALRSEPGTLALYPGAKNNGKPLESAVLHQMDDVKDGVAEQRTSILADWLVRYAIEMVQMADTSPLAKELRALCRSLNIGMMS